MWNKEIHSICAFFKINVPKCHFIDVLLHKISKTRRCSDCPPQFIKHIKTMKRLLILLFTAVIAVGSRAQIFNFGFPDGFTQRQKVQQDPVTPPEYKGGNSKLNKFIEKTFQNPQERKNVDGKITVACIIGTNGKVVDAQIVRGINRDLNDEAIRVSKKLKFKPAKQGKKKIKSRFDVIFPIRAGRLSFSDLPTVEV